MKIKPKKSKDSNALMRRIFLFFTCFIFASVTSIYAQTKTVSGKVTDQVNEPLIGVSVQVQSTSTGTVTDIDGTYSISAKQGDILVFSYLGMKTQSVTVGAQNTINMVLQDDAKLLSETVVIGYGSAKKRDLTGSIVSIKAEDIANRPSANPLASLQGKVAGVQVVNTGIAGQDPEIRARISNSMKGRPKSEETKLKMKEAAARRAADPEYRKKCSESAKNRKSKKD